MTLRPLVITIDGPAGSGKSSVAKELAARLNIKYMNTGNMYRLLAKAAVEKGIDPQDEKQIASLIDDLDFSQVDGMGQENRTLLKEIQQLDVGDMASRVSTHPLVREKLVAIQREKALNSGGVIVEGRDAANVIVPESPHKFYLTAAPSVRAQRISTKLGTSEENSMAMLEKRDKRDSSRVSSPMEIPQGSHIIDTSKKSLEEVVEIILNEIERN